MKNLRLALCILSIASVALLAIALGRQAADPDQGRRQSAPVSQVAPHSSDSVAATRASEKSDLAAAASEERKESPALTASAPASIPANGDDEPRHPGDRVDPATIVRRHGNKPLDQNHPTIAAAIEVQERNNRWLMANPAVVGTAVGLNDDADVAIIVYTKVDAPEIPKAIEGVPVAVWRSGEFFARRWTQETMKVKNGGDAQGKGNGKPPAPDPEPDPVPPPPPPADPTAWFDRPVPIGVSTGHPDITAGTIGCRVSKGGQVYALSNNHVYANENLAKVPKDDVPGDKVLQPGVVDGGNPATDSIGELADFQPIVFGGGPNTIDAAIALSSTGNLGTGTPSPGGYGTPKASMTVPGALGMKVKKYGRTTRLTLGEISAINATANVGYDTGVATFVNQIIIKKRKGSASTFSAGGDSGSLIVGDGGTVVGVPVGLLFAGSQTLTIGNPIGAVLDRFGVTIDGE